MKILLAAINAKYIHSNPAVYSLRAYAGETLREHIELAEYTINMRMQKILADLYERKPEVIGFSCYIWNWDMLRELLAELPKILPGTDIWLGGPEVCFDAQEILEEFAQVSGVMIGEGEETFREIAGRYVSAADGGGLKRRLSEADFRDIRGLALRGGSTGMREAIDLSAVPFIYEDLEAFENRILYYESSRGCPYRCSYCLSSVEKSVRFRDLALVRKELQFFLDKKVKQVKFVDRTFNCDHRHAMAIWEYIHEHDNGVTNFHFEIAADLLREDEIDLLNRFRPGLVQLEIGVQSTNPDTIAAVDRVADINTLARKVEAVRRGRNVHLHLDLIAGLPCEDYDSFVRSFNRVYGMRPQQLQLGFLKVLKGSPIESRAAEYGIAHLSRPPYEVLATRWISFGEIQRLKRVEEMVELYYNSCQFTRTLPFLVRAFEHPFAMFEALADFYADRGYFTESPARALRYEILFEFALARDPAYGEVYRQLLCCDLYLRENLKSRPAFLDRAADGESVRSFYKAEEKERRYLPDYVRYDWKQMSKMTHLEAFSYPVWDEEKTAALREDRPGAAAAPRAKEYVLFDYRKRDPLTYEAAVQVVSPIFGTDVGG